MYSSTVTVTVSRDSPWQAQMYHDLLRARYMLPVYEYDSLLHSNVLPESIFLRSPPPPPLPTPAYFPGIKHTQKRRLAYTVILEEEPEYACKGTEGVAITGSCRPLRRKTEPLEVMKILCSDDYHVKYHYPRSNSLLAIPSHSCYCNTLVLPRLYEVHLHKRKGKKRKEKKYFWIQAGKPVRHTIRMQSMHSQHHFQKGLLIL